ncbi:hypothetical protein JAB5_54510 [Janthinobacterium sp. HH103]|jgi:hypothetical protein|nr:hypothetical protein JAB5_54510 [Janthinobacterium sp. HH103]OEZ71958.1 hypothetical protein JAB2_06360 [Janthinobacterium sp. HH100]OEZ90530.1 hypothetical protein JAB8_19730 [Janthinobacterium sp. HH106]PJJ06723.1 hypothetical protein CLU90_5688 [Janthinobacterium sp. 67]QOU76414.1 hypothetical protein JAB4_059140 [Janthinobacterium sp. HH102]
MVNDDSKNEPILESANLVLLLVAEMREQRIGFKY